jgi:hypothetical protein
MVEPVSWNHWGEKDDCFNSLESASIKNILSDW